MGFAERVISNATRHLRIIAPPGVDAASLPFQHVQTSGEEHERLLAKIQRLRGAIYLRDGAISSRDLDATGRHISAADLTSWHLVHVGSDGEIDGCARYRSHSDLQSFNELDACRAAIAADRQWGAAMRQAICYELLESAHSKCDFFEVSGWAIAERARFSEVAFTVAVATYALGRFLGGGRGIATATTRNHSSRILQRLGGRPLSCKGSPLPPYFDPRFGCVMELISFDTAKPDPKYSSFVRKLVDWMPTLPTLFTADTAMAGSGSSWEMAA